MVIACYVYSSILLHRVLYEDFDKLRPSGLRLETNGLMLRPKGRLTGIERTY